MSAAFKAAADRKRDKKAAEREERQRRAQAKLDAARSRASIQKPKPQPQRPKWEDDVSEHNGINVDAIAKAIGAPATAKPSTTAYRDAKAALTPEQRTDRLQRIAQSGAPKTEPPRVAPPTPAWMQEPSVSPPAPSDPRVKNGSLAPSQRVADHIKAAVPEPAPIPEKPLQTSSMPEAYARVLESGSPRAILAGRKPSDLRGTDLEAFERAMKREGDGVSDDRAPMARKSRTPIEDMSPFGLAVTRLRVTAGLTVRQLAALAGVAKSTIIRPTYDHEHAPFPATLTKLAYALGVPVEALTQPAAVAPDAPPPAPPAPSPVADAAEPATEERQYHYTRPRRPPAFALAHITPYGKLLTKLRLERGFTVAQLADKAGVSVGVVSNPLGNPPRPIGRGSIMKLAKALGVPPSRMIGAYNKSSAVPARDYPAPVAAAAPAPDETTADVLAGRKLADLNRDERHRFHQALGRASVAARRERGTISTPRIRGNDVPAAPTAPAPATVDAAWVSAGPAAEWPSDDQKPNGAGQAVYANRPTIEKGIPVPEIFLSSAMYPWEDMERGDSFKADCPVGMPWPVFANRFTVMVANMQKKTKHWYTTDRAKDQTHIRVWRVV